MFRRYLSSGVIMLMVLLIAGCGTPEPAQPVDLEAIKAQLDAGQVSEALTALEAAVKQEPENAEAHFLLGVAYFKTGAYEKARETFNRTLELDPARAAAVHHNLGALAIQLEDLDTAVAEFQASLALEPDDPDTHYQLGAAYLLQALPANENAAPLQEKLELARAEFTRALELAPGKAEVLVGMGNAYLLEGDITQATVYLEQAVAAAPEMPEALFGLGRIYALTGNVEQAREMLERCLAANPPQSWAEQAQELLKQLGD